MREIKTYIKSLESLDGLSEKVTHIIIECRDFSRFGKLSLAESLELAKEAKAKGLHTSFEWDLLLNDSKLFSLSDKLKNTDLSNFDSLRVQDMGAYYFALNNLKIDIELILEHSFHNFESVRKIVESGNGRVKNIVLSPELPLEKINQYKRELSTSVEILGFGRILLFYTPRSLLNHHSPEKINLNQSFIEASGTSEESPHKGFPLIENLHGTFMFHIKELCLLEHTNEIEADFIRIDQRFGDNYLDKIAGLFCEFKESDFVKFKEVYPVKLTRGFSKTNKTDVLFKKLKNKLIQREDANYIGEVLEVKKKEYMAIWLKIKKPRLSVGHEIKIITPEGKEKFTKIQKLTDCSNQPVDELQMDQIILINHVGGVSLKSAIYLNQ